MLLLVLVPLLWLTAAASGALLARAMRSPNALLGAAWGAVTGPAYALVIALLDSLTADARFGLTADLSVFASFLLLGTLFGGFGGAIFAAVRPAQP